MRRPTRFGNSRRPTNTTTTRTIQEGDPYVTTELVDTRKHVSGTFQARSHRVRSGELLHINLVLSELPDNDEKLEFGRSLVRKRAALKMLAHVLVGILFVAITVFLLVSICPNLYYGSYQYYGKPQPPPKRTYSERVKYVEEVVRNPKILITPAMAFDSSSGSPLMEYQDTYDIYNCPLEPPPSYPNEFPIMDVLNDWPIADTDMTKRPRAVHQGLCVFDFAKLGETRARQLMNKYQKKVVPFVIKNHPQVLMSVERWNAPGYLHHLLQNKVYRGEFSRNLSMMYWVISKLHKVPAGFVPPTKLRPTTFEQWNHQADVLDSAQNSSDVPEKSYLRLDACESPSKRCDAIHRKWYGTMGAGIYLLTQLSDADFIHDELPFFSPKYYEHGISADFLVEPHKSRGIQCRFGAKGLVAEDHFDNERNMIAVLGGERRYILGHPKNCKDMSLYPMLHPLERHTQVDWFAPNVTAFPNFDKVRVNEVVLEAGDVLYLPTYWFHHIVSLSKNYQCNVRSGHSLHYDQDIYDCGFLYPWPAE